MLARYGWDRIADGTLAVYEEVLAERAGAGSSAAEPDEQPAERDDFRGDDSAVLGVAR